MKNRRHVIQSDMVADALAEAEKGEQRDAKAYRVAPIPSGAIPPRVLTGQELIEGWASYEDRRASRSHEGKAISCGGGSNSPTPIPAKPEKQILTDKEWAQIRTGVKFTPWQYNDDDFGAYLKVERALCRMNWDGKTIRAFRAWLFNWITGRPTTGTVLWNERRDAMRNRPRTLLLVLLRELRKPTDSKPQSAGGNARAGNMTPEERSRIARDAASKRWSA